MADKWTLTVAIHKGTITSRDVGRPREFDSEKEAMSTFNEDRKWYRSIGYQIWFATPKAPDGTETTLESNPYY